MLQPIPYPLSWELWIGETDRQSCRYCPGVVRTGGLSCRGAFGADESAVTPSGSFTHGVSRAGGVVLSLHRAGASVPDWTSFSNLWSAASAVLPRSLCTAATTGKDQVIVASSACRQTGTKRHGPA